MVDSTKPVAMPLGQPIKGIPVNVAQEPNVPVAEQTTGEAPVLSLVEPSETPAPVPKTEAEQALDLKIEEERASVLASMGAGMGGLGIDIYRSARSALIYERDPNFNHQPLSDEFFAQAGAGTPEEVKYLADAKNDADHEDRTRYITDNRMRHQAMADNPVSGFVGSLVDVDIAVGGAKIRNVANATSTVGRLGTRAGAGVIGAGAMVGIQAAQGDNTLRTEGEQLGDAFTMGISRSLAPLAKGQPQVVAGAGTQAAQPAVPTNVQQSVNNAANQVQQQIQTYTPPTGTPTQQVSKNKYIAALQSTADYLRYITNGDTNTVVNKLLSNPAFNNGDDVVSLQQVYLNNYGQRLNAFSDAFRDAIAATGTRSNPISRISGRYARAAEAVGSDFQVALQRVDADVLDYYKTNGVLPNDVEFNKMLAAQGNEPHINALVKAYMDSGIAEKAYDDMLSSPLTIREEVDAATGNTIQTNMMDDIVRRPTYMRLQHDYDRMAHTVEVTKRATWDEMATFIGDQITKMYPELLNPKGAGKAFKLSVKQVGDHYLQTQSQASRGLSDVSAVGMSVEEMAELLTKSGQVTQKEAVSLASEIYKRSHDKGTSMPKHLRRRIDWDWNATMRTASGYKLSMRDFVDSNVMGNLEGYTTSLGHRLGLAGYGLKSEADLDNLLESYYSKLPADVTPQEARQFMRNTKDTLMGRPIENNPVPEGVRSAQAVADMFLLANSGLYGMVDVATQLQKVGVIRSIPAMRKGLKAVFKSMSKISKQDAKDLEDILTLRMLQGSQWKNFVPRYADNFEVSGGIHEAAQYYGQSARFMNLSESLKRFQVGILASVYARNLKHAMKGDAKELAFMKDKLKIDGTLIREIEKEYAKHGTNIDNWTNAVRVKYEQKIYHDADNLAMSVHNGEVPAILEHSAVGRIIFPYMRYTFAMQNKVLRRTYNRDGATGLAMLLAFQIPTAMLVAAAINVRKEKEPDHDLAMGTIKSMTVFGSLNYPFEIAMSGLDGGSVTALAPFGKTYNFGKELFTGGEDGKVSPYKLIKNSPINAAPLDYLALALED